MLFSLFNFCFCLEMTTKFDIIKKLKQLANNIKRIKIMEMFEALSKEFNIKEEYSKNLIALLDEGNTIPFIARYRKEMHGSLDDQVIRAFADRLVYLRNFEDRKKTIIKSIDEQGKLTEEIVKKLDQAKTLTELEDIYRPYKQKKKNTCNRSDCKRSSRTCRYYHGSKRKWKNT